MLLMRQALSDHHLFLRGEYLAVDLGTFVAKAGQYNFRIGGRHRKGLTDKQAALFPFDRKVRKLLSIADHIKYQRGRNHRTQLRIIFGRPGQDAGLNFATGQLFSKFWHLKNSNPRACL
ncbi:MAG: hypothetical protein ACD_39C01173G0001 [uncultured bacterium]|nr:MAG: hypothetical protein ACD_39C01173G0001 [uncultured bacterium]